jgi:Fe-S cluster biosynthesis and repair protein YggX
MSTMIMCQKLGVESPALDTPPYPGELGTRIQQHISKKAWEQWLNHQTMLINEYRLNLMEAESRQFLKTEMEKFLFGKGSDRPPGYVEEKSN